MAERALVVAAFASSYVGFALLALLQKPHHTAVSGGSGRGALPPARQRRCAALGGASVTLGGALCLVAEGPSFGSILWVLSLGAAALAVTFTLTYRPHWLAPIQRAATGVVNVPSGRERT